MNIEQSEQDWQLMLEEAYDELLESIGDEERIVDEANKYTQEQKDEVVNAWKDAMAKASADSIAKQVNIPADKVQEWISQSSKKTNKGSGDKTTNQQQSTGDGNGDGNGEDVKDQEGGTDGNEKQSFLVKKAVEKGKNIINKKVGGPEGVQRFVENNQKVIDERMTNKSGKVMEAWNVIKKAAKSGAKSCLAFCKKHWKAITIILIVVCVIAYLLYKLNGAGSEQLLQSKTVTNAAGDITNGAKELGNVASGGGDDSVIMNWIKKNGLKVDSSNGSDFDVTSKDGFEICSGYEDGNGITAHGGTSLGGIELPKGISAYDVIQFLSKHKEKFL